MTNASHGYIYELLRKLGLSTFQASTGEFLLVRPLKIALIIVLAIVVARLTARALRRVIGTAQRRSPLRASSARAEQRADTVGDVVGSLARSAILALGFLMALGQLGLNLAPLIAGAGIAGVAIGFGAQALVRDFLSGLFILLEDQYGVGDTIDLGGDVVGVVEELNLRTTRVRAADGTVFFVPNGGIARVGNASMDFSRAVVDIPIGKDADVVASLAAVNDVATKLGEEWSERITQSPQMLGVQTILPAEGPVVRVTATTSAGDQFAVARELRLRILERLRGGVAKK
ncbi:MAG TPA: mechanosensitive ion channel domain-containing protein [Acidimicrobiales bacterium]|nr:mechanosensitive ion channel domain-containing protein [Acidimicrobiales bacterium]